MVHIITMIVMNIMVLIMMMIVRMYLLMMMISWLYEDGQLFNEFCLLDIVDKQTQFKLYVSVI